MEFKGAGVLVRPHEKDEKPMIFACRGCLPEINQMYPDHRVSDRFCRLHYLLWGEADGFLEPDEKAELKRIRLRNKIESALFLGGLAVLSFAICFFGWKFFDWVLNGFVIVR